MTGPELTLAEALGVILATRDDLHEWWIVAICELLTPAEIVAAVELAMRMRGESEVWIELTRDETMAAARTLSLLPDLDHDGNERNEVR